MTTQGGEGYAHPEFLVETEWLADHLNDDNLRIVDTDVADAYRRSHIPGAVMIPDNYEKDPDTDRVHILPTDRFAEVMESLGIGDDTLVVAYDYSRSLYAGRLWWALNYYGHKNVKVLNGGWRKWVSEGRPAGIDRPKPRPGVKFTPQQDNSLIATTEELKESHNRPDVAVWDVRSIEEYKGENTRGNQRPGHIPGASHLEWLEMMDMETHTFKPASEMRRILESKGITPDKEVVAH
jgi:thiosulfate/3-mercaptopyruvate sulfurtransferase